MLLIFGVLLTVSVTIHASPLFGKYEDDNNSNLKVLTDQRQEGGWNIHADLKNFLFLILPTPTKSLPNTNSSSSSSVSSASALELGLLALLAKSGNNQRQRLHHHNVKSGKQPVNAISTSDEETKHFIESKSAPYQVDISKSSGGLLSKFYPDGEDSKVKTEGAIVAKSPIISFLKDQIAGRGARAVVFAIPNEDIYISKNKKKLRKKARDANVKKGATSSECGAGEVRDSYGNCKVLKY